MLHHLRNLIAAVCLTATAATAQDTINVPLDQAGALATRALLAGEPTVALQIAQAVLSQNPDDRAALLVVAAAAPQLGDPTAGRIAGARAWELSEGDIQKYEAARLTALAAANEDRLTLATFWLRLALTAAPNDEELARTTRDARAIAQRNPWSTQLSFSLAPSSNVNGGAEDAESTAPGNPTGTLSVDALALSGWRGSIGVSTQLRFQESEKSRSFIGVSYRGGRVWLTEDTDIPNEAFHTDALELNLRHERALENGTIAIQGTTGVFEYRDLDLGSGVADYQKYDLNRLRLDRRLALTETLLLSLSAQREELAYLATGIGDVTRNSASASLSYRLEGNDRLGLSYRLTNSVGDSVNYTSIEHTISASYSWAEPVGPVSLSIGGGFKWIDYPDYRLLSPVTGGRQDETVFANMNIGFPAINYAGFSPGLRIDASKADSNVSRFDRTTFSVGLTASSSF